MGAYLNVENSDQLVRLNIGAVPDYLDIADWVLQTGDLLYFLIPETRYVHVRLDMEMLGHVRESTARKGDGLYRDARGKPTLLATYLALVFLEREVPVSAIARELGLSEMTMNWLRDVWHHADGVIDRGELLRLIRLLTFEDDEQD
ncbi:hypothetical protein [Caballeronia sp. PC1]|uniref:hypothetical protein n=1 Tax=Caballeronia sp. PC1 TaxID=2906765 RepID=UPI0007C45E86|nr:hypothetical protein [Caballeronia sp. PC1]MCE4541507.1 hypothetical protein [Caballeronia sp. PC1]